MSLAFHVQGRTDVGMERDHNEDAFASGQTPTGGWMLAVCDGMGGHEAGEVASLVSIERLQEVLLTPGEGDPAQRIFDGIVAANQAVLDEADRANLPTMGTTAVVALIEEDQLWYGWVGDSRLYHFRDGALLHRSVDHTHVQRMVDFGILTPEEARHHPDANVLTQALGGGRGAQAEFSPSISEDPVELQPGDVVLLCSDGLYDLIDDDELYPLIAGHDLDGALTNLIREANDRGGHDNITALLLLVGAEQAGPAAPPDATFGPGPAGSGPAGSGPSAPASRGGGDAPLEARWSVWQDRLLRYAFPLVAGLALGGVLGYVLRVQR